MFIVGLLYTRKGTTLLEDEIHQRGIALARHLARESEYGLLSRNIDALKKTCSSFLGPKDVIHLEIIDKNGRILAACGDGYQAKDTSVFSAPVMVLKNPETEDEALIDFWAESSIERIGKVKAWLSRTDVVKKMDSLRTYVAAVFFTVLLASVVLSAAFIKKYVATPISRLREGATRIAHGELDYQVIIESNDEFCDLAHAFNDMARSLRRQINDTVKKATDAVQQKNLALLGELSAMLLHEVGNTLNRFGVIRYRLSRENLTPEGEEALEDFERELGSLERFTRNVSLFSKKPVLILGTVDIKRLLQGLCASLNIMDKQGNRVKLHVPDRPCLFTGDKELLNQAILNVIKNALDAVSDSGKVEVILTCQKEQILISVIDNGEGIPGDKIENIFKPFFSTKGPLGTGLGLAIAKSFIEAHGGTIDVKSRPGHTVFFIGLPTNIPWFHRQC